jgi:hypothetical protein
VHQSMSSRTGLKAAGSTASDKDTTLLVDATAQHVRLLPVKGPKKYRNVTVSYGTCGKRTNLVPRCHKRRSASLLLLLVQSAVQTAAVSTHASCSLFRAQTPTPALQRQPNSTNAQLRRRRYPWEGKMTSRRCRVVDGVECVVRQHRCNRACHLPALVLSLK